MWTTSPLFEIVSNNMNCHVSGVMINIVPSIESKPGAHTLNINVLIKCIDGLFRSGPKLPSK